MSKQSRTTAGALSLKASADTTDYDVIDAGKAVVEDTTEQIQMCIDAHKDVFDEDEFCIVIVLAGDPLIRNVQRRKYYAWPYLPSPRPNQSVFLYNRRSDHATFLWALPRAEVMATLSSLLVVDKKYARMKLWCDAFYDKTFWQLIRKQHGISMLSESEYLAAHRDELVKACPNNLPAENTDPFDFSKISSNEFVNSVDISGV